MKQKYSDPRMSSDNISLFKQIRNANRRSALGKIMAVLLILALAAADVFTILELFGKLNTDPVQKWVYSLSFALCLEGIPTFLGMCASKWADASKYKKNDQLIAIIGFIVAFIGLCIAFFLVVQLRWGLIQSYGGKEAFINGQYAAGTTTEFKPDLNGSFLKDRFLMISPVVTSFLAFVTSWVAFPSDHYADLERELDLMHMQYIEAESEFNIARATLDLAKMSLWKDLADSDTSMPQSTNSFRKECFSRIRNLLFTDCIQKYRMSISDYNNMIEKELRGYLKIMAGRTTIPEVIDSMKLEDIIARFDENIKKEHGDPKNCWGYTKVIDPMEKDLKQLLNNAIVVAQFRSTTSPRYKEGTKW